LRVFLRSAKGAARTAKGVRNKLAPHSVLRVILKSPVLGAPPQDALKCMRVAVDQARQQGASAQSLSVR
jgi:hypothetical protein